jgi:hypothetical protein
MVPLVIIAMRVFFTRRKVRGLFWYCQGRNENLDQNLHDSRICKILDALNSCKFEYKYCVDNQYLEVLRGAQAADGAHAAPAAQPIVKF